MKTQTIEYPFSSDNSVKLKEIWLAGGCFWGTEEYFSRVERIVATAVGYANSNTENPTYEEVCTGRTGAAEAVYLQYAPETLSLSFLLDLFYQSIDPLSLNRQGADKGTQYRTGVYFLEEKDREIIDSSIDQLAKKLEQSVVVEHQRLENFYLAEENHQHYLKKNPSGYCHLPARLFAYAEQARDYKVKPEEELRQTLTEEQYRITRENGTEKPFENEYNDEFRKGIYVSVSTGEPLFVSSDKFDAGCGWPAFSRPIADVKINEKIDTSGGRVRTEVRTSLGDDHLGHVFEDGPEELGGLRYCINSASLSFIPLEEMKEKGYEKYISYIK